MNDIAIKGLVNAINGADSSQVKPIGGNSEGSFEKVINEVYDLFIDLDASEEQIDFSILYTNAKLGVAHKELNDNSKSLQPLFETIISEIP